MNIFSMRHIHLIIITIITTTLTACTESRDDQMDELPTNNELHHIQNNQESAEQHALSNVEMIRDFHAIYPEATGYFSHYLSDPVWNSTAWLYGRYELHMQLPVTLSDDMRSIHKVGKPAFTLLEITHIEKLADGRFSVGYGYNWKFEQDTWAKIMQAGGKIEKVFQNQPPHAKPGDAMDADLETFSAIHVDDPIPSFDAYVQRMKLMK